MSCKCSLFFQISVLIFLNLHTIQIISLTLTLDSIWITLWIPPKKNPWFFCIFCIFTQFQNCHTLFQLYLTFSKSFFFFQIYILFNKKYLYIFKRFFFLAKLSLKKLFKFIKFFHFYIFSVWIFYLCLWIFRIRGRFTIKFTVVLRPLEGPFAFLMDRGATWGGGGGQ